MHTQCADSVLALDALAESNTVACPFPPWVRELWWNMKAHDKGKLPSVILLVETDFFFFFYFFSSFFSLPPSVSFSPMDRMGILDVFLSLCYQFSQEDIFGRHEIEYLDMAWQIFWLLLVEAAVHIFVVVGLEEWKTPVSECDSPGEWAN